MADVKVAINGFGRIGRLAFRQMFGAKGYDVVAINDLTKPSMLAQLLKYDTAQGGYCGKIGENLHTVTADDEKGTITVDGKTLTIYAEKDAKDLPWGKIGVDVVLECTGFYCSKDKSQAHIDAGAKKVVSLLRQATTSRPSFSPLTRRPCPLTTRSFPLLPAPLTASLLWLRH